MTRLQIVVIIILTLLALSCNNGSTDNKNAVFADTASPINSITESKCIGALGDVKYSVLDEADFIHENGPCWVLMNEIAPADAQQYQLFQRYKIDSIPDARGVFIRGMNKGRSSSKGDVDTNRTMGSYQQDSFANHIHKLSGGHGDPNGSLTNWALENIGRFNSPFSGTSPGGGPETRPRNICLYIYIKVN